VDGLITASCPSSGVAFTFSPSNPVRFGRKSWVVFPLGSVFRRSMAKPRHPAMGFGMLQKRRVSSSFA
jgi:hypothetical protein